MTTFTYVTVSYCYVGVSYPVVGYAGVGYWRVSYPVVGYGFVGVTYCYVSEGYCGVGYRGVWCSEMWRRTHRWGLTRGVAVDRIEVQQRGKREKGTPMDIEIDFFEELGGYYTADLADVLEDFEG